MYVRSTFFDCSFIAFNLPPPPTYRRTGDDDSSTRSTVAISDTTCVRSGDSSWRVSKGVAAPTAATGAAAAGAILVGDILEGDGDRGPGEAAEARDAADASGDRGPADPLRSDALLSFEDLNAEKNPRLASGAAAARSALSAR